MMLKKAKDIIIKDFNLLRRTSSLFKKYGKQPVDIRTIPGVKSNLFGPQSLEYINKLTTILNTGLTTLSTVSGSKPIDFKSVALISSLGPGYAGSLAALIQFSRILLSYATAKSTQPYTVDQAKAMEDALSKKIANSAFTEAAGITIKDNLISILNQWKAILG